jgi:hypothetical protein
MKPVIPDLEIGSFEAGMMAGARSLPLRGVEKAGLTGKDNRGLFCTATGAEKVRLGVSLLPR